jgi:hypothetical protein
MSGRQAAQCRQLEAAVRAPAIISRVPAISQRCRPAIACSLSRPLHNRWSPGYLGQGRTDDVCGQLAAEAEKRSDEPPKVERMWARWLVVLLTAVALVATPLVVPALAGAARPGAGAEVSAGQLAERVRGSATVGWSGLAETAGTLQVPDSDSFATLALLLGETSRLRVWWRTPDDWRVDRIRSTGETDLFRQRGMSVRWVFESETATYSPVSRIRLPDESDLVPATLARFLLQGAREDELSRLPDRVVAGVAAAGVRLTPREPATTIGFVDLWVEAASGLALAVDVYGRTDQRPVLSTSMQEIHIAVPAAQTTRFTPHEGVTLNYEESVDVAARANALAPYDLPASLAGLASRAGDDPDAVGIYGRGPTTVIALPLRGRIAWQLRDRLQGSAQAQQTAVGVLAPVGPILLLVTPPAERDAFLLAGTVTVDTLQRAATELAATP